MKATYLTLIALIMVGMSSCSGSDEITDNTNTESTSIISLSTLKSMYGAQDVTTETIDTSNVPSIAIKQMQGILEAMYQSSKTVKNCIVTQANNTKKVTMTETYVTESRSGLNENLDLNVVMNFSNDNGTVYYWGTDYKYSTSYFKWSANSMSLSPSKTDSGYVYDFSSEGYLYFKVSDAGNIVLRVPVIFKGSHNFNTDKGTYSFQLVKCSK